MERSFEDLLTGLSDESEPELDDMIVADIDNTNLEVSSLKCDITVVSNLKLSRPKFKTSAIIVINWFFRIPQCYFLHLFENSFLF